MQVLALQHQSSSLSRSVETGRQASDKLLLVEQELARRNQHVLGLENEIKRQREELHTRNSMASAFSEELGETKGAVNALQNRVSELAGQLHTRTNELQVANKDLSEHRDFFAAQRKETEKARAEVGRLEHQSQALQSRLNKVEEDLLRVTDELQSTQTLLDTERCTSEKLLSRAQASEQEAKAKSAEVADYLSRVQDMDSRLQELTLGVQSKDECLAKMVSSRQSLAVEVAAMREDGEHLRGQVEEGSSQLQIAHQRILTLENRIREHEAALEEAEAVKTALKTSEGECETLTLKVQELHNEKHRAEDMLQLLQDKDVLLHDALRKNTALVAEISQATTEKDVLRQQVMMLEEKNVKDAETIQDLQIRLSKSSDAIDFSNNVLALSREQTESLHALREQLNEQEIIVKSKEEQLESVRAAAERDTTDLRRRLIAVTEHNQALQMERKVSSGKKTTPEESQTPHKGTTLTSIIPHAERRLRGGAIQGTGRGVASAARGFN